MKTNLMSFALTSLVMGLSSCAMPSGIQLVSTTRVIDSQPGVIGPVTTVNGVAIHQYSPKLYSPFLYAHESLADNEYQRERNLRYERRGSVHVGPLMAASHTSASAMYEVRHAIPMRKK